MGGVLHITNGDSAAERIRTAGIEGEILCWKDVLHEGPVPGKLGPAQLREVRARFIAERGWSSEAEVREGFAERDAMVDASGNRAEVVLWFEHDLYDQLQLSQILHRYGTQGPDPDRLSLAVENEYLGMLSVDRIRALHARRVPLDRAHVHAAVDAWTAFTAPESSELVRVAQEDLSALPYLAPALRRQLEEYPSTHTGLSRSEQQALEVIAEGGVTVGQAFHASHHKREEAVFLGDTVFAWYLERMSRVKVPLVVFDDGRPIVANGGGYQDAFWKAQVRLTDAGREVLAGKGNAIALNGIDRWLGGVHLEAPSGRPWLPPH
ncbi:MAG TPA: DUF1835 domain-containing protein [Gemmatimonadales bacterium]|jgi:hypothetical protein